MELYRTTTLGLSLSKALNHMIQDGSITTEKAAKVLLAFDTSITSTMGELQLENVPNKVEMKGTLSSYNNIDNYWRIDAENVVLDTGFRKIGLKRIRLLAEHEPKRRKSRR